MGVGAVVGGWLRPRHWRRPETPNITATSAKSSPRNWQSFEGKENEDQEEYDEEYESIKQNAGTPPSHCTPHELQHFLALERAPCSFSMHVRARAGGKASRPRLVTSIVLSASGAAAGA